MKTLRNSVSIIGNLGTNPEVKQTNAGKKVATLNVATTETYKTAQGTYEKNTQWHRVIAWGKLAEISEKYIQKGHEVAVQGSLVYRNYTDKSGVTKYITEILANEVLLLDKRK